MPKPPGQSEHAGRRRARETQSDGGDARPLDSARCRMRWSSFAKWPDSRQGPTAASRTSGPILTILQLAGPIYRPSLILPGWALSGEDSSGCRVLAQGFVARGSSGGFRVNVATGLRANSPFVLVREAIRDSRQPEYNLAVGLRMSAV